MSPVQQVQHPGETALRLILDATCVNNADNDALADSGTVVLTGVSGGTFTGTFDVVMDSGDHVTGTFDAPTCSEQRNPEPTCQ